MDDDVYQNRQDPAVTVGLRLETGELALVWTTTPWTLPANLGIMVGPDIDYVVVESDVTGTPERYVLGEARLARLREGPLPGRRRPAASTSSSGSRAPTCWAASSSRRSTTTWGTPRRTTSSRPSSSPPRTAPGWSTRAGAFGEEDKIVTDAAGIEPVVPVGPDGRFTYPVTDYEGLLVFDANLPIIDHLKARTRGEGDHGAVTAGTVLLRRETYDHAYPHCWRCREPLIYMAVSSWFVEVTKIKERMLELNEGISWTPDHIKHGQFGKWLENARDWSITRNRFWGSPFPVWKSDNPHVPADRRLRLVRGARA